MFRTLAALFGNRSAAFTDYERAVLDAIAEALAPPLRERFAQRLAAVTAIRRRDSGRDIAFEQKAGGRLVYPAETRLSDVAGDALLARFTVSSRATLSSLQGKAWLIDGNLASLAFIHPTEHARVDDIHRITVKIDEAVNP